MTRLRACGGAIAALVLSGALHAAGLLIVAAPPQRIAVAGGGTPDIAAIGAAFEDFVAGAVPVSPAAQPAVAPAQRSLALPASAVADLAVPVLARIMQSESIEICAVALSKLPVAKAAEVLAKTPGDRARRITYAMSMTGDVTPDVVRRIGRALAQEYGHPPATAFDKAPVQRLGAILNSAATDTREDVLEGLGAKDPVFASDVRKAIFTFKDIAPRVKPNDISTCTRAVDAAVLSTAIAAALAGDADVVASAEYVLANLSQRMAAQLREDAAERGPIKKADAEAAMAAITTAVRELADGGLIVLRDPDQEE